MTKLRLLTATLVAPAAASAALAQAPAGLPASQSIPFNGAAVPPLAPVPPVGSPVGIGSYPALPTSPTLWSFLGMSRAQREYRQRMQADTPFGELRSKIRQPLSDATGGLIPPVPPEFPSLAELQDPGAVGAAAKVKLDRLAAKKRIKAVQYLGTVDCHYWPEAEDALVNALRVDRNEWVRLAAAQTLLRGCCCTKKTILALTMAATCSNADGNPTEKSPRVVAAAQAALSKCLEGLCCSPVCMADGMFEEAPIGQTPDVTPPVGPGGSGSPPVPPKKDPVKGEGQPVAMSKPGPAGTEKGSGGLTIDQVATPSSKELYERAAARPWGEMIAFSKAHLAKAPSVPAEYLQQALTELNVDDEDDSAPGAAPVAVRRRPANLYDALFGDTNTAKVAVARSQPTIVPAQAMFAAAPTRMIPTTTPVPPPVRTAYAPAQGRTVEPARMTVKVPDRSATPAPTVKQATMITPARVGLTPAAVRALDALDGRDAKAVTVAVDTLGTADVSINGPVPFALLRAAEQNADTTARSACVRALARCKASSPAVVAGLERLTSDRNVEVRVEAAVALNELKSK